MDQFLSRDEDEQAIQSLASWLKWRVRLQAARLAANVRSARPHVTQGLPKSEFIELALLSCLGRGRTVIHRRVYSRSNFRTPRAVRRLSGRRTARRRTTTRSSGAHRQEATSFVATPMSADWRIRLRR